MKERDAGDVVFDLIKWGLIIAIAVIIIWGLLQLF